MSDDLVNDHNAAQSAISTISKQSAGAPTYSPQSVASERSKQAVPQESVGFEQVEQPQTTVPASSSNILPTKQGGNTAPTANQADASSNSVSPPRVSDLPVQSFLQDEPATPAPPHNDNFSQITRQVDEQTSDGDDNLPQPKPVATANQDSANDERSPLEILEEILAEANDKKAKKQTEEEVKQKEDEEQKATMAAKEAQYQLEAQQKIKAAKQDLAQAVVQRQAVEEELESQGKGQENQTELPDEQHAIGQLKHDKVNQN